MPGPVRRLEFPWTVTETRTDVRVRIRRIVTAIRTTDTGVRIRVVVRPIDHTAYGESAYELQN